MEDSYQGEIVVVPIDDELQAILEVAALVMEPVVSSVYGCLGVELLLSSHECCPGDVGIDVEVLLGVRGPFESSYLCCLYRG